MATHFNSMQTEKKGFLLAAEMFFIVIRNGEIRF